MGSDPVSSEMSEEKSGIVISHHVVIFMVICVTGATPHCSAADKSGGVCVCTVTDNVHATHTIDVNFRSTTYPFCGKKWKGISRIHYWYHITNSWFVVVRARFTMRQGRQFARGPLAKRSPNS